MLNEVATGSVNESNQEVLTVYLRLEQPLLAMKYFQSAYKAR